MTDALLSYVVGLTAIALVFGAMVGALIAGAASESRRMHWRRRALEAEADNASLRLELRQARESVATDVIVMGEWRRGA